MIERKADLEVRVHEHEEILVTLREDRGRAQQKRHEAESSAELEQAAWTNFLNLLGISTALTPEGAGEVFAQAEQAKVLLRAWEDHAKEFEQILRDAHAFNEALNLVLEECGWDRVGLGESAATLATLKRELEEQHMKRRDRSLATDLLSEKHQEEESLRAERDHVHEQHQQLLNAADASDSEDFRQRAVVSKRRMELERESAHLDIALGFHANSQEERRTVEDTLATHSQADLERCLADTKEEEHNRLTTALAQAQQEKGRVEHQLQNLEHNDRLSAALFDHQSLLAQLDHSIQRWSVRALTRCLLDTARQIYERERQPAVLQQASEFFRTLTNGRYRRVMVPLGETRLDVESHPGHPQGTERLSRGTAEQLYLSMRFAFVREYAKHAGVLPLIMDDILVNFDPGRAKAAITVLKDMSTTHQILFFTCHSHVTSWFKEVFDTLELRGVPRRAT